MRRKRNPYLTRAMERVLKWMIGAGADGELVVEGRECWYGLNRTNHIVVRKLLQLALIRDEDALADMKVRHYTVNEDGRRCVNQVAYIPAIVRELAKSS